MNQFEPVPEKSNNNSFLFLNIAVFISNVGNGLNNIILGKLLFDKTGNVFSFGAMFFLEHIFNLIFGAISGVIVDLINPKLICVAVDFIRGGVILVTSYLYFKSNDYKWIYLGVVFNNFVKPFNRGASFRFPTLLFQKDILLKFNLWMNTSLQVGYLVGASLVFPILKFANIIIAFYINGASYLLSSLLISFISFKTLKSREKIKVSVFTFFVDEWKSLIYLLKNRADIILISLESSLGFLLITMTFPQSLLRPSLSHTAYTSLS